MRDTIKIDRKNVKMVAHRGLSGLEKENTAAAFVAAGNRESYFGMETDVHNTSDGKFVIIHDVDLNRLAGLNINVEETPLEEIQKTILINNFGKAPRRDYITPSFEDYLEICGKYGKHAVLEIKSDMSSEQLTKLVEIIKEYDMLENTIFISFTLNVLVRLREILPEHPMQLLTSSCSDEIIEILEKYHFGLDIMYPALSEEQIKLLKSKNIEINIWTCDSKEDAEKYIGWGVDYITSNILQ